jgi:geranylgeranyl diphosphate synthase, type II
MHIEEQIKQKAKEIDSILEEYLPVAQGKQKTVLEAMRYSVEAGGKRLRPMLMREAFLLFGGEGKVIEPFMAAIEMIHTYSLIHDDLPAMDNDEYRRGKKTAHVVYGEDIAILAGDGLLNYSMETALKATAFTSEKERVLKSLSLLYRKSGVYGMIGGQTVDVSTDKDCAITREQLDFIYQLKTSALMEASLMIGAILAGAGEAEVKELELAASEIGLAFQIQDDILDLTSTMEELGKPIGSDEKNKKATYVSFEGLEKSAEDVKRLSNSAIGRLSVFEKEDHFLTELVAYLITRKK